jgi:chromate transporter
MDAVRNAKMNAATSGSNVLVSLFLHFVLLSLFAVGGASAAIPEIHRIAVEVQHWMTDRQFADMFAISQVSPGPNVIIVALIGYHAAGFAGAMVATVAMCGPTCVLAFWIGRIWDRFKQARWRVAIQAGLVPVSIGLMAASAYIVAGAADRNAIAAAITAVAAAVTYWTRINPLWIFAVAGAVGFAGFV